MSVSYANTPQNYCAYPQYSYHNPQSCNTIPPTPGGVVNINIINPSVYGKEGESKTKIDDIPYKPIYDYSPKSEKENNEEKSIRTEYPKPLELNRKKELLTPAYIDNLEDSLKNPNEMIKIRAIKDLMERFKEDDMRKYNEDLNYLLNIALKDKNNTVKMFAMTTIASGYAGGDEETIKELKKIERTTTNYTEDAKLASYALDTIYNPNN